MDGPVDDAAAPQQVRVEHDLLILPVSLSDGQHASCRGSKHRRLAVPVQAQILAVPIRPQP